MPCPRLESLPVHFTHRLASASTLHTLLAALARLPMLHCTPARRQQEEQPRLTSLPHLRPAPDAAGCLATAADSRAVAPAVPLASPFVAQLQRMGSRDLPAQQQQQQPPSGLARPHSGMSRGGGAPVSSGDGRSPLSPAAARAPPQLVPCVVKYAAAGSDVRIELCSSSTPRLSLAGECSTPSPCASPHPGPCLSLEPVGPCKAADVLWIPGPTLWPLLASQSNVTAR